MVAMDNTRMVTAALGGYMLGRMGKGKAALRLGLRLSGAGKDVRKLLAGQDDSVLKHQGQAIALHLYEGMADRLANALEHRVESTRALEHRPAASTR